MELRKYKYIRNNRQLPTYNDSKSDGTGGLINMDIRGINPVNISSAIPTPTLDSKIADMNKNLAGMKFGPTIPKQKIDMGGMLDKVGGVANSVTGAVGAISNAFNAPIKTGTQMNQEAGVNNTSVGGVNTQLQNAVDMGAQRREIDAENKSNTMAAATGGAKAGSQIGSLLGPVGKWAGGALGGLFGGIAGIFGGNSRKRKLEERMRNLYVQQQSNNQVRMDTAMTTAMDNDWSTTHEDTSDDILFANNGKSSMRKFNNGKVWSPEGYHYGQTNSKVGLGESIVNFRTGKGTLVTKGTKGVDNQDSSVQEGDDNTIFGNITNPYSGMLFSDQAAPLTAQLQYLNSMKVKNRGKQSSLSNFTQQVQQREIDRAKQQTLTQLQQLADQQEQVHQATGQGNYNCGKLPRFNDGDDAIDQYLNNVDVLGRKPTWSYFNPAPETFKGRDLSEINNMGFENIPTQRISPVGIQTQTNNFAPEYAQYPSFMDRNFNRILRSDMRSKPDQLSSRANPSSPTAVTPQLELPAVAVGSEKSAKKNAFLNSLGNFLAPKENTLGNYHTIPSLATALAGYSQYNRANNEDIKGSNIYAPNTYAQMALRGLASQRLDPYAYMRPMYDAERRGAYQMNNSGGMSGGQRQLGRVALALGSQQNIADTLRNIDEKNLGYKQQYYSALLNEGDRDATRRQSASQYDFDTYAKAHAAREQMRQMGVRNMLSALWQNEANRFKRDMGNKQLALYGRQLNNDQLALLNLIKKGASK